MNHLWFTLVCSLVREIKDPTALAHIRRHCQPTNPVTKIVAIMTKSSEAGIAERATRVGVINWIIFVLDFVNLLSELKGN